jgi:ribosomal protein S18 acetylase RimI-like enzyme
MPVRTAVAEDVPQIAQLHVSVWRAAYRGHVPDAYLDGLDASNSRERWTKNLRDSNRFVVVATDDHHVVGFCSLMPSRDADAPRSVGEITALYVDANRWRRGHGTALVDSAIDTAPSRGFSELTLWVLTANDGARAFYVARGFEPDGHTKTDQRDGFALVETRYRRSVART